MLFTTRPGIVVAVACASPACLAGLTVRHHPALVFIIAVAHLRPSVIPPPATAWRPVSAFHQWRGQVKIFRVFWSHQPHRRRGDICRGCGLRTVCRGTLRLRGWNCQKKIAKRWAPSASLRLRGQHTRRNSRPAPSAGHALLLISFIRVSLNGAPIAGDIVSVRPKRSASPVSSQAGGQRRWQHVLSTRHLPDQPSSPLIHGPCARCWGRRKMRLNWISLAAKAPPRRASVLAVWLCCLPPRTSHY